MTNKLYSKIKKYIKENYKFIIMLVLLYSILNYPLPYYIHSTGGTINISDRISMKEETPSKGSFNLTYVTEMKGNVLTYLFSLVMKDWDLVRKEEIELNNETIKELEYRNKMLLEEANQNAILVAYNLANKYYSITEHHSYVVYIDPIADTNLKVKDEIISVNGININSIEDYKKIVENSNVGDTLNVLVKENGKEKNKYIKVIENNNKITGIYFIVKENIVTDPDIKFNFSSKESGPSGGFIMALSIYDKLIDKDLTGGKKIVGTGTIDRDGNVGAIGGVEYKLKSAVKDKADIFFVPKDNYEEVLKEKKDNKYNIEIVSISNIMEAIDYLNKEE